MVGAETAQLAKFGGDTTCTLFMKCIKNTPSTLEAHNLISRNESFQVYMCISWRCTWSVGTYSCMETAYSRCPDQEIAHRPARECLKLTATAAPLKQEPEDFCEEHRHQGIHRHKLKHRRDRYPLAKAAREARVAATSGPGLGNHQPTTSTSWQDKGQSLPYSTLPQLPSFEGYHGYQEYQGPRIVFSQLPKEHSMPSSQPSTIQSIPPVYAFPPSLRIPSACGYPEPSQEYHSSSSSFSPSSQPYPYHSSSSTACSQAQQQQPPSSYDTGSKERHSTSQL